MRTAPIASLLAGLLAVASLAEPTQVSAVNLPAWLERSAQSRPIIPGTLLQPGDVLRTGPGARLLLTLPEGSQIRLGENAVFRVDNLNLSDGRRSAFAATLNVLQGAFRFTTGLLAKARQREVDIHVATITAGIRGTDVWGKADEEKDLVCLLEGRISVAHGGETASMDAPLSFFVAPKGKPALPIAAVDPAKVSEEWAPQTEVQHGKGLMQRSGGWRLVVATAAEQDEILRWYSSLREAGYAAKVRPVGQHQYRLSLENLASEADATTLGEQLKAALNIPLQTVLPMNR